MSRIWSRSPRTGRRRQRRIATAISVDRSLGRFQKVVTSKEELREIYGEPTELVVRKQLAALDAHARAFIARAPFVLLGTSGASGRCDVSPKGDAGGFA